MMILKKFYLVIIASFIANLSSFSQEGIAVYTDYLLDNYYLVHPSMAGAASCGKIRATARQQWFGVEDAPALQTLSFNTKVGEEGKSGIGAIVFNDKNGYHAQQGGKLTYAYHIDAYTASGNINKFSFGINGAFINSTLDTSEFPTDPTDIGTRENATYFNVDLGGSYHYNEFYTHFTTKNLLANKRALYSDLESSNTRKYLLSSGFLFNYDRGFTPFMFEPSIMFMYIENTNEMSLDLNAKLYYPMDFGRLWGGASYRRAFETTYNGRGQQAMEYITPIIGVNYKQYMFAYNYSYLTGKAKFDNQGFHQLTLGIDVFCRSERYHCICPAIN